MAIISLMYIPISKLLTVYIKSIRININLDNLFNVKIKLGGKYK